MSDTTYNGWTNYPTWCVNLWLDNDQYTHEESHRVARHAYLRALTRADIWGFSEPDPAIRDEHQRAYARLVASDRLKEYVEELLDDERADMGGDLQSWALGHVDWHNIVTSWLADDLDNEDDSIEEDDDDDDEPD